MTSTGGEFYSRDIEEEDEEEEEEVSEVFINNVPSGLRCFFVCNSAHDSQPYSGSLAC